MKKGILKNVKSIMRKSKSNRAIKIAKTFTIAALLLTTAIPVAAATDTTAIDTIVDFFATWITKIGLVVAFFGGCQVGFAFKNDDSDAKTRGLHTVASGLIVAGICAARGIFGL